MSEVAKKVYRSATFQFILSQWFLIALAIFIIIARFAPNFARHGGLIRAEYTIGYGAVAIIFLQSGLSMSTQKLCVNLSNWRAHLVVLFLSFLLTSSIIFGFCYLIMSSGTDKIDKWLLVGLILTASTPTTVASNVVMTRKAQGNDILCLCEVFIGNILGTFVTPAMVQFYLSTNLFSFGNPANGSSIQNLYADVIKQIGLSVFLPLFVGQVLQNCFPKQVEWTLKTFFLNKVGSICLLMIMFSSFSTAFYQHAFTSVSHVSIIFVVFFNLGIYLFFTLLCFVCARPWFIPKIFSHEPSSNSWSLYATSYRIFRPFYYNRRDAVAILFCGPAKTAALGVSLVSSQYGSDFPELGKLLVPLVLYQSEQVATAQIIVPLIRSWVNREIEESESICSTHSSSIQDEEIIIRTSSACSKSKSCFDGDEALAP